MRPYWGCSKVTSGNEQGGGSAPSLYITVSNVPTVDVSHLDQNDTIEVGRVQISAGLFRMLGRIGRAQREVFPMCAPKGSAARPSRRKRARYQVDCHFMPIPWVSP